MKENKTIKEIRMAQLKVFIENKFDSVAEFASEFGVNKNNIYTLLEGKRPFSDSTANKIENHFALPKGYLSSEDDKNHIITEFVDVSFYENIKNIADLNSKKHIRIATQLLSQFNLRNSDSIITIKTDDELMYPTISKGEFIIIDTLQNTVEKNKLYLFKVDEVLQIRRVISFDKNTITIHIDNENEKKYLPDNIPLTEIEVIGRIIGGMKSYN